MIPHENINERYELRHSNKLKPVVSHTTQFKESYLPKTVDDWNALDENTKSSQKYSSFLRCLNSSTTTPPEYYCVNLVIEK